MASRKQTNQKAAPRHKANSAAIKSAEKAAKTAARTVSKAINKPSRPAPKPAINKAKRAPVVKAAATSPKGMPKKSNARPVKPSAAKGSLKKRRTPM